MKKIFKQEKGLMPSVTAMSSLISLGSMEKKTQPARFAGRSNFSGSKEPTRRTMWLWLLWFQILLWEGREIGWPEFKERVFARLRPTQFYDHFGELTKLQQEV